MKSVSAVESNTGWLQRLLKSSIPSNLPLCKSCNRVRRIWLFKKKILIKYRKVKITESNSKPTKTDQEFCDFIHNNS